MVTMKESDTFYDLFFQIKKENKPVDIILKSGQIISGTVQTIGKLNVLIKLVEKSFYDAVVSLEEIAAIEYQARTS